MKLEFEQETHTYRLDGRKVPSVTQVLSLLSDYGHVQDDVLQRAAAFGTAAHLACHLDNIGQLDESSLDDALLPYLSAWRAWLRSSGGKVVGSEVRCCHTKLGYAGTCDALVRLRSHAAPLVCDIKTGAVPRTVAPQTAAYRAALDDMGTAVSTSRLCVQLREDGSFSVLKLSNFADMNIFTSALNIWRWKNTGEKQ